MVIATVGTLASRVDIVLLALPLLLSAAISLDQRPAEDSSSRLQIDVAQRAHADGTSEFAYDVALEAPPGTAFVHLRLAPQSAPVFDLILAADHIDRVAGGLPVVHSGRQRVVDVSYRLIGVNGAWISAPSPIVVAERVVDPALAPIASIPLPHRLSGLTGTHAAASSAICIPMRRAIACVASTGSRPHGARRGSAISMCDARTRRRMRRWCW